jgi:hypothetical protein
MKTPKKGKTGGSNNGRKPGNTTVTMSVPKELKARMVAAATADRRKVSPWAVIQLEMLLDAMDQAKSLPPLRALDAPAAAPKVAGAEGN